MQRFPFPQPFEVVGDEGGCEIHRVAELLLAIPDQLLLELIQWQRSVLLHAAGEGCAE